MTMQDLYDAISHYRATPIKENLYRVHEIALGLFMQGDLSREQLDMMIA